MDQTTGRGAHRAYQRIRRIEFKNPPKSISGKIRRIDLRARENACEPDGLTQEHRDRSRLVRMGFVDTRLCLAAAYASDCPVLCSTCSAKAQLGGR